MPGGWSTRTAAKPARMRDVGRTLSPLPQPFPGKSAWLASVGCESRPWDVGGSLGLEGEAAGL